MITISKDLREFFSKYKENTIEVLDYSNDKWHIHTAVDKETRKFNLVSLYSSKELWDYSKEEECNIIIREWCLIFKLSNFKRRDFLLLLNNNLSEIEPTYTKGDSWL